MSAAESRDTFAFGIDLRLTTTAEGGRRRPLLGGADREHRFNYRPNWGLPGMTPPGQTGAPVFGFSRENIAPGESCRAVIVAFFPAELLRWASVGERTDLPMYEGTRVCGMGRVRWRAETELPVPPADETRFLRWLQRG
jgi:hypothetical protein